MVIKDEKATERVSSDRGVVGGGGAQQQTAGTADIIRLWLIGDFTSPIVETDGDTISQQ